MVADSVPLKEHLATIHELEGKYYDERDRRYTEVALEREKALRIKEEADRTALTLARENQNLKDENQKQVQLYKDEKANELREQINRERNLYASKDDLSRILSTIEVRLEPLTTFMNREAGGQLKTGQMLAAAIGIAVIIGAIIGVITFLAGN